MYLEVVYESRTAFVNVNYTKVSDFLFESWPQHYF